MANDGLVDSDLVDSGEEPCNKVFAAISHNSLVVHGTTVLAGFI